MSPVDANDVQQILARAVDLTARKDYSSALSAFEAVYQAVPQDDFPQGLSAFGLCLSQVRHKNKMGADLCEKAIALQPVETSHWANLVRLYAGAKNTKKAIETLDLGLKKHPKDAKLLKVGEELGLRKTAGRKGGGGGKPAEKYGKVILYIIAGLLIAGIIASVIWLFMQ